MDRIKGFDGLRALALAAVFLQHYTGLGRTLEMGSEGVWLFFALSGFLIIRILHAERLRIEAGTATRAHALRRFFWRRSLRILPIYYLVLALFTVLGALGLAKDFTFPGAWMHFAYLSNVLAADLGDWSGRFGYFWSLAVEEQFYLLAGPALLLAPAAWARPICAMVVMVAFTHHLLLRLAGAADIVVYTDSLVNFGVVAFGGWVALALPARPRTGGRSWPALLCLGLVAALVWAFPKLGLFPVAVANLIGGAPLVVTGILATLALAGVYLNQGSLVVKALEWRPLAWLGRISYGLYLYHNLPPHWLLTWASRRWDWGWAPTENQEAAFSFLLVLVLATASWHLIERPLLARKDSPPDVAAWVRGWRGWLGRPTRTIGAEA
jgi:peptidoglycan/LPS O-acetylase OafA/YrhL